MISKEECTFTEETSMKESLDYFKEISPFNREFGGSINNSFSLFPINESSNEENRNLEGKNHKNESSDQQEKLSNEKVFIKKLILTKLGPSLEYSIDFGANVNLEEK